MGRIVVSAADVRAAGEGGRLVLPAGAAVTPLGYDVARELGVTLVDDAAPAAPDPASNTSTPAGPPAGDRPPDLGAPRPLTSERPGDTAGIEGRVRAIVTSLLATQTTPPAAARGPGQVTLVRSAEASLQDFGHPGPGPDQVVRCADVVTSADGAPMAAGYMTLTRGSFPWTLTYDEVQIVLEGELHIGTPDGVRVGRPGDVLYVPKGSKITFGTPGWAKFVYVTFPADWEGQIG